MRLCCEVYKLGSGLGKRNETWCGVWRSYLGQNSTFLFCGVNKDVGYTVFLGCDMMSNLMFGIRWVMGYGIMKIVMRIEDISGGQAC